jgi:hypothetical protein
MKKLVRNILEGVIWTATIGGGSALVHHSITQEQKGLISSTDRALGVAIGGAFILWIPYIHIKESIKAAVNKKFANEEDEKLKTLSMKLSDAKIDRSSKFILGSLGVLSAVVGTIINSEQLTTVAIPCALSLGPNIGKTCSEIKEELIEYKNFLYDWDAAIEENKKISNESPQQEKQYEIGSNPNLT